MKRKNLFVILIILAIGVTASAYILDANFSVPIVNGTANAGTNPPQGAIIYDTSTSAFYGNTVVPSGGSPNWVALSASANPRSEIFLVGGTGYGSTNTYVRTFTSTPVVNTGSDITYTSSATLGDYFTINNAGVYTITYGDSWGGSGSNVMDICITLNSAHLNSPATGSDPASPYSQLNTYTRLGFTSVTLNLSSGAVIRAQDANLALGATDSTNDVQFRITKVSN